jgi:phosphatidate cytidylyltransferase
MLRARILTAVVAGLMLLAVLFALPALFARVIIAGLLLIGAWEWSGFFGSGNGSRYAFVALVAAMIVPAFVWLQDIGDFEAIFQIALVWWVLAFIWIFFYPTPIAKPVAWLCGVLVIVPAFIALDWLYQLGVWNLLFMLAIVWVADIGAYFAGKAFGRVKLAVSISPGKTWEGVIGGLIAVTLLIGAESAMLGFPMLEVLPLGLAVAVISVVGDLTVSMFKRSVGVKDSGTLFPGHGGLLDRADGIMAAAPVFALGMIWLNPGMLGIGS